MRKQFFILVFIFLCSGPGMIENTRKATKTSLMQQVNRASGQEPGPGWGEYFLALHKKFSTDLENLLTDFPAMKKLMMNDSLSFLCPG